MERVRRAPTSYGVPPRPWWVVGLAFVFLVIAMAGLMFGLRWCGGPGERPRIRPIPLPPLVTAEPL